MMTTSVPLSRTPAGQGSFLCKSGPIYVVSFYLITRQFTHNNWGLSLRCLHTSIFIETPSLEGLPAKSKEDPSPHEMRLSPLDINPVFPGLGYYYYYYHYYHHYYYFIFLTNNEQFCNVCKTLVYLVPQRNQSYFFINPQFHL